MARIDELRLMAKVARMYHTHGMRQTEICNRLSIHQSTVSRLLARAEAEGIIRTMVTLPSGTHTEIEDALQARFGLADAIVVDCLNNNDEQIARDLGAAAAFYLENTLKPSDVVGISAWSSALLAMVNAMHPSKKFKNTGVVQILGGVGNPNAEVHAAQVTRRLADLIGAQACLLPAPGVVGSKSARDVLLKDRFVHEAIEQFAAVTLALVGIGTVEPSRGLASSGNVFSPAEVQTLVSKGAVGDICLRFFNQQGQQVTSELNDRVISMEYDQLRRVRRVVGVAGGKRKWAAIRGAVAGGLVKVLITDLATAENLLAVAGNEPSGPAKRIVKGVRSQ
ncbi:DNA-binding transcriptional regulator [Bryobacterales bacterium F-183]|nr:DNA-binding transcriptional regulator [Bryobacterales bacterium F-183]